MPRKSSQPALYEVLGRRDRGDDTVTARPRRDKPGLASAGRSVRVPIGYLWLAGGVLLVIVVGSFSAGYLRGEQVGTTAWEEDWLASQGASLPHPVPPPEVAAPGPEALQPPPTAIEAAAAIKGAAAPPAWGPITSDPRVAGHNYFVLIHTRRDDAISLAQFCRDLGVEAYVVRAKNVSLFRVIALPGYAKGERSSEAVLALERRIEKVARNWKLQVNPRDDLAADPERFDG